MPAANSRANTISDAMKSEVKLMKPDKGGEDIIDSIIRQAIGKQPYVSLSKAVDNPAEWIRLLLEQQEKTKAIRSSKVENSIEGKEQPLELYSRTNSFSSEMKAFEDSDHSLKGIANHVNGAKNTSEQLPDLGVSEIVALAQASAKANGEPEKYLQGWPLISPPKVQLQKCDKCSLEFCSSINYRRHMRIHRRSLKIVKDSSKSREFLGAFWDKLTTEEAKKLVSFDNVAVQEVTGSKVISELSSWIQKPGRPSLPLTYVKAGVTLLDVVQARSSRFPITSEELFGALDDASEKTFLCSGTALSVQKYVFDGEAVKNALDKKNQIACASFLVEQILVKAWLADKDAEALRCQKLLVDEEEAAHRRQAALLEKKRLKKLRQKEQRAKDLPDVENVIISPNNVEGSIDSIETPSPRSPSVSVLITSEAAFNENLSSLGTMGPADPSPGADSRQLLHVEDVNQIAGHQTNVPISSRHPASNQIRKPLNGFHSGQVPAPKCSGFIKHGNYGNYRDSKAVPLINGHKIWTPKYKPETEADRHEKVIVGGDNREEPGLCGKTQVMIGSISIALGDGTSHPCHATSSLEYVQEKLVKSDSSQASLKQWRPVSRPGTGDSATTDTGIRDVNGGPAVAAGHNSSRIECISSAEMSSVGIERCPIPVVVPASGILSKPTLFSREIAEAFFAQRWKEAMEADHVKLVLSPQTDTSSCPDQLESNQSGSRPVSLDRPVRNILGSTENRLTGPASTELASACASKPKFKTKPEKNYKLKYVPKRKGSAGE